MYRTIFFNCWVALIAFAIYFCSTIYQTNGFATPVPTLAWSFMWAIIGFIAAYGIRAILEYVFYTPEQIDLASENEELLPNNEQSGVDVVNRTVPTSTVEFQDESTEEVAQVIRTMLNQEETIKS